MNQSILKYSLEKLVECLIFMKKIQNWFGVAKCYEMMFEVKQILELPSFFEIQSYYRAIDEMKIIDYM